MKRTYVIALSMMISTFYCHAAKPVKIIPVKSDVIGGKEYRLYSVECSNGAKQPVTAWDSGKHWCVGEASENDCGKKQIRAAKKACK
jgi:hypothetical protein